MMVGRKVWQRLPQRHDFIIYSLFEFNRYSEIADHQFQHRSYSICLIRNFQGTKVPRIIHRRQFENVIVKNRN